ncbi:MAG: efflux RND transporter periplasmic adaptor subunit [Acidobacteriaceae bacterium]
MTRIAVLTAACCVAALLAQTGCNGKFDPAGGEAPHAQVIETSNAAIVSVAHPEQYPTLAVGSIDEPERLDVTGAVYPDISREIPVISMANGRVVDIRARLDDNVKKGQLLFSVLSTDISSAFDTYVKAAADEQLANKQYLRSEDLYQHGAISQSMLEQAADSEQDAKADLSAADQQLKIFGVDKNHPSPIVNVYAPATGVIVAQNITQAAAIGVNLSGSATAFTIADLSRVWIICDVYENDLPKVRLGQQAEIHLTAYPDKVLIGRVSDIGPVLDPTIRTAKVRIEVANPGILRLGMFVTATLTSRTVTPHATVPASAILHLHDRDWVFEPVGQNEFKRVAVIPGVALPHNQQEILSGVQPGEQVVKDVLNLQATAEAK